MSKQHRFDKGKALPHRRYEIVISKNETGIEQLAIFPLFEPVDPPSVPLSHEQLVNLACWIYDMRRSRSRYFHNSLFGEPVWDMLLALFCLPARGERLTVTGLCHAANAPMTTGLRWTQLMEQKRLIERVPDPFDGRRVHVRLTQYGEQLMRDYLTTVHAKLY